MNLKFSKKPVMIEAFQMTVARWECRDEWPEWLEAAYMAGIEAAPGAYIENALHIYDDGEIAINVDEGRVSVPQGHWIIREVDGTLSPCDPEFFEATYDAFDPTGYDDEAPERTVFVVDIMGPEGQLVIDADTVATIREEGHPDRYMFSKDGQTVMEVPGQTLVAWRKMPRSAVPHAAATGTSVTPDIYAHAWNAGYEKAVRDHQEEVPAGKGIIPKTLHNTDVDGATKNVPDIVKFGNGDMFQLLSKASSQREGWMKSTKAMETPMGCVVQVTTQQRNPDGSYAVAEALTFVPGAIILDDPDTGGRKLGERDYTF